MHLGTIRKFMLLSGTSLLAAANAAAAQEAEAPAQDTAATAAQTAPAAPVEEILVIGSQIQGAQINDVLPVTVVDEQQIEMLPSRDTMALINITNIIGVNLAIAVNAASINASANATAMQYLGSWQH